jgi:phosphoglycolate phosphatase
VKVIVFDFDGTLADTFSLAIKCMNQLAPEYGYKPLESIKDREIFRENGMKEIVSNHLKLWFYQLPGYTARAKKIFNQNLNEVTIFAGIKEALQRLAAKYGLAIITSNSEENVKKTLEKGGVSVIKDVYSDSSIFGKHTVIKRFLKTHNLEPDEIIYVGDEIRDIDACRKIGVKIIAVTWGYNSKSALEKSKPDYLVDSFEELEKILE